MNDTATIHQLSVGAASHASMTVAAVTTPEDRHDEIAISPLPAQR